MRKLITVFILMLMVATAAMAKPDVKPEEIYEHNNGVTLVTTAFFNLSEDAYDYIESLHLRTIGSPKKMKSTINLTSSYNASYHTVTHYGNKQITYQYLYVRCGDYIKEYKVTEDEDYILQKAKLEGRL